MFKRIVSICLVGCVVASCHSMQKAKSLLKPLYYQKFSKDWNRRNPYLSFIEPIDDYKKNAEHTTIKPLLLVNMEKEQQKIAAMEYLTSSVILNTYLVGGVAELEKGYHALSKEQQEIFEFVLLKYLNQECSFCEQEKLPMPQNIEELNRWLHEIMHRQRNSI